MFRLTAAVIIFASVPWSAGAKRLKIALVQSAVGPTVEDNCNRIVDVPAIVTLGREGLWTEIAELAAVAGAQIHVHLDHDASTGSEAGLRRLQVWANLASFLTFSATVNVVDSAIWDDLRSRDEVRAYLNSLPNQMCCLPFDLRPPQLDSGAAEVYATWGANLVARAGRGRSLLVAMRRVHRMNPYHPARTANLNPQMAPWYALGAQLVLPPEMVHGAQSWAPPTRLTATGPLDDPAALPGQLIVAGSNPGYLKYNGGGPAFLSGPDDPEAFFFLGQLDPGGTRSGGPQQQIIRRLAATGVSAFHVQMFRMRRCNIKDEGDDTHNPFIGHDPTKGLNRAVLDQWDGWLGELEKAGVVVHLEFYNDATDVERMGWKLDARGNLHPDEERFITGIVNRFKHHKNILWGIEESANKLPGARTPHFKRIAEAIARTDNHHHPIVQSFVIPNDPEDDFPPGGILSDAYYRDPHIRVVTWLHLIPHGDDVDMQYREYLRYSKRDSPHFVVMKNETFWRPYVAGDPLGRRYSWAAVMAGLHNLEAQHKADRTAHEPRLREHGYIARFMEQTDFYRMQPHSELASGSTRWVLANPGESYIAYTFNGSAALGLKGMTAGTYNLLWLDTIDGRTVSQTEVAVASGEAKWTRPDSFSSEIALYVKRAASER